MPIYLSLVYTNPEHVASTHHRSTPIERHTKEDRAMCLWQTRGTAEPHCEPTGRRRSVGQRKFMDIVIPKAEVVSR